MLYAYTTVLALVEKISKVRLDLGVLGAGRLCLF